MVFGCQSIENTAITNVLDRLYAEHRVYYRVFDGKHFKNTVKNNVFEGFLYICLNWPAALEHGKIEENIVNSSLFKGLGEIRELETL